MASILARPELRQRLVALHGQEPGYLEATLSLVEKASGPESRTVSRVFLSYVLNGQRTCPSWLAVALIRIAEGKMTMERECAWSVQDDWFDSGGE